MVSVLRGQMFPREIRIKNNISVREIRGDQTDRLVDRVNRAKDAYIGKDRFQYTMTPLRSWCCRYNLSNLRGSRRTKTLIAAATKTDHLIASRGFVSLC